MDRSNRVAIGPISLFTMRLRLSWLLPGILFALHTLLLLGCTWMVMRGPNDPLAKVFFMPVMAVDFPMLPVFMAGEPLTEQAAVWLEPIAGGAGEASALAWALVLGVLGPLPWLALSWWIGRRLDRRFVARRERVTPLPASVLVGSRE